MGHGMELCYLETGANNNMIDGNFFGTNNGVGINSSNNGSNIRIENGANANIIGTNGDGDSDLGELNIIGDAEIDGITISGNGTDNNTMKGNYIGVQLNGQNDFGNTGFGIRIHNGASNNLVGSDNNDTVEENIIAFNGNAGISIEDDATDGNTLSFNSFFDNGGLAIDLENNGITANDGGDTDDGANNEVNFPVIESSDVTATGVTLSGTLDLDTAEDLAIIEIYEVDADGLGAGEGKTFVTSVVPNSSGDWSVNTANIELNDVISAITTDINGNTSEFSTNYTVIDNLLSFEGTIFEEVNFDGRTGTAFEQGVDKELENVVVELYSSTGTFLDSDTTNSSGAYFLESASLDGTGDFIVRTVTSSFQDAPVIPNGGLNGGLTAIPEQVFESNGETDNGGAGAFGGNIRGNDDTFLLETEGVGNVNVAITVTSEDSTKTGIDFGFNYTIVTHTGTTGVGSLEQAIINANAIEGANEILFDTVGTLALSADLPIINDLTGGVAIRGYSSPGASKNTNEINSLNAVFGFEIDGEIIGAGSFFTLTSAENTIEGLVISGDPEDAILITGTGASNNNIFGNYIGTDSGGTIDNGNGDFGIRIENGASSNTIGTNNDGDNDAGERNLISGNDGGGIIITGTGSESNVISGNLIGLQRDAVLPLENLGNGIYITSGADNNIIGAQNWDTIERNEIVTNSGAGVFIEGENTTGNRISQNRIYQNRDLGIDLAPEGVTANDAGDVDVGANNLINKPVITSALRLNASEVQVTGTVDIDSTLENAVVEIFRSDDDPSGEGEGFVFVGSGSRNFRKYLAKNGNLFINRLNTHSSTY